MKQAIQLALIIVFALTVGIQAQAQTPSSNSIKIESPWARATPKGARTGAAYMTLVNDGASADRLVGATTPLADKVQFHKETEHNGVSHMSQMQSVDIQPGAKIAFKPGDMHIMIVGLKQPLAQGQTFPLTLLRGLCCATAVGVLWPVFGPARSSGVRGPCVGLALGLSRKTSGLYT